jgi:hypothetical protein
VSLNGLKAFPELSWLGIDNTQITDVTPISVLKKLTGIGINGTQIKDYSPIRELPASSFISLFGGAESIDIRQLTTFPYILRVPSFGIWTGQYNRTSESMKIIYLTSTAIVRS